MDPLQAHGVSLSALMDEIEDAIDYARRYLVLKSTDYRKVWYNLHICPDSRKWPNILLLCELGFSLSFSNGRVEQIFSCLKIVKGNNRTSLNTSTLDDLLEIFVEGPPLTDFSADSAVDLWWKDCCTTRRPNQGARKPYRLQHSSRSPSSSSDAGPSSSSASEDLEPESESQETISLNDWDDLFMQNEENF